MITFQIGQQRPAQRRCIRFASDLDSLLPLPLYYRSSDRFPDRRRIPT